MESIIYELNGKKYVMLEVPFTQGNNAEMERRIKKHDGIMQGVKEVDKKYRYAIGNVLIPEANIDAFNADGYSTRNNDDGFLLPFEIKIIAYIFLATMIGTIVFGILYRAL